jgi:hypothetical protein
MRRVVLAGNRDYEGCAMSLLLKPTDARTFQVGDEFVVDLREVR